MRRIPVKNKELPGLLWKEKSQLVPLLWPKWKWVIVVHTVVMSLLVFFNWSDDKGELGPSWLFVFAYDFLIFWILMLLAGLVFFF